MYSNQKTSRGGRFGPPPRRGIGLNATGSEWSWTWNTLMILALPMIRPYYSKPEAFPCYLKSLFKVKLRVFPWNFRVIGLKAQTMGYAFKIWRIFSSKMPFLQIPPITHWSDWQSIHAWAAMASTFATSLNPMDFPLYWDFGEKIIANWAAPRCQTCGFPLNVT